MRELKPLKDQVLVRLDENKSVTASGIILPGEEKKRSYIGEVLSTGPEVKNVKQGDKILFAKYSTTDVHGFGEGTISLVQEEKIFAIIND